METEKLENLKLKLETTLNRKMIEELIEIIRDVSDNIYQNKEKDEILQDLNIKLDFIMGLYKHMKETITTFVEE